MNKIIKEQLEKCKVAVIPKYDESTTRIYISKSDGNKLNVYHIGKCYLIELADFILNPNSDSTLSSNWNKGSIPPGKHLKVEICEVVGKMVRVHGYTYDLINYRDLFQTWQGWLPISGVTLLYELK